MTKITAYAALASTQPDDMLPVVDVHDTSMAASGTTKQITVAGLLGYPDQQPAAQAGLQGAAGLTTLAAAVANRNSARCDIAVIGDSVTEGQGAALFTSRWIAQANRAVRITYPTAANGSSGGLGFIPIQETGVTLDTFTWPVTPVSGTHQNIAIGPVRYSANMSSATTFTWTAPAGTTNIKIMYFDAAVAGTFSYQVGAGGAVSVVNGGTLDGKLTALIPITGGTLLTIAWVSGSAFPEGIIHYAGDETSGVTFNGCGHYGWSTGTAGNGWMQAGPGFDWRPAVANLASGALAIMLGTNDCVNFTAAVFQANLQALITYLRGNAALGALPLLLIIPYQGNTSYVSGSWAAYTAAIRAVQAANANTSCIDLSCRMPSVASGFQGGALYSDTVHPSNLGHALIGEIMAAGIRVA